MYHCGVGGEFVEEPQGGQSCAAVMDQSALDSLSMNLVEQVVESENMERAWKKVKANRGASSSTRMSKSKLAGASASKSVINEDFLTGP